MSGFLPVTECEALLAAKCINLQRELDTPTPERLREWARWFNQNSPRDGWSRKSRFGEPKILNPAFMLAEIADALEAAEGEGTCPGCIRRKTDQMEPSHEGSKRCESGSIASGGKRAHCTCGVCY